ncbi:MAG: hypothetical protein J6Y01_08070 [Spirochaetales bacterium]|nr:hypothetical protein [Spirochaetales bacterium]
MLNWQNVIQYYGMNLSLLQNNPNVGTLVIPFNNGRSQCVVLNCYNTPYGDILDIISYIGEGVRPNAALSLLTDFESIASMGGITADNEGCVTVRNTIPLFGMDNLQAVQFCIENVASTADYFEATYFGVDNE